MLELTLRSTVILAAAWLLTRLLRRATAATRHLVWHAAVIVVLLAPVLQLVVPTYSIAQIFAVPQGVQAGSTTVRTDAAGRAPDAPVTTVTSVAPRASASAHARFAGELRRDLAPVIAWLGTLATALWFTAGWIATSAKVRRSKPAPVAWHIELHALCERLRIGREIRLGLVAGAPSPLAAGIWRSAILLPERSLAWSAERRRDCRMQLLTHAACALHWFNPLIWIAARRIRSERERACDDEVLCGGTRPSTYAWHLLEIAREVQPVLGPSAALAMARPSELEGRLLAVLAEAGERIPSRFGRWAVLAALSSITIIVLGASVGARPVTPASTARVGYSVQNDVIVRDHRRAAAETGSRAEAVLQQSPDPEERQQAAIVVSDAGQAGAIATLRAALNDSSSDVREKAALGLAFLSGREVVPALLEALDDRDAQVREKAAIGLALRRDERAILPLIAAMSDPDSQVREKAAMALGTSGDARARAPLPRALTDADSQVREKAASGLLLLDFGHLQNR
jgi:beta-lactamase regulating signal transducer with metallopeptidase domain